MGYIAGMLSTGWESPTQVYPLESFGPCAMAGAKFTAVSKATVAPASSRGFISVPRDNSPKTGIAVISRVGRLTAAALPGNLGMRLLTPRHNIMMSRHRDVMI